MSDSTLVKNWKQGILDFNSGRYWHAHEAWERGWRGLSEPEKTHVQALIQTAGIFDLVRRGRPEAAKRLAGLALEKVRQIHVAGGMGTRFPRVEIQGLEELLVRITLFSDAEIAAQLPTFSPESRLLLSPP